MKSTLVLCALVVGTFTTINASAQERAGILDGASSNWISRGGSTKALKNSYLGRFDEEKRRNDAAIFNGGWVRLHDFNTTTKDSFKFVLHSETAPGSNNLNAKPMFASVVLPVKLGINVATFKRPVPRPKGDFWFGPQFQQGGAANDGGFVFILRGGSKTATGSIDLPGPGIKNTANPAVDSFYAFWQATTTGPGTPARSGTARTVYAQPLHDPSKRAGGSVIAKTDQSTQQSLKGIIAGNSGHYPDLAPTTGNKRTKGDDIGYRVNAALAKGKPVVFMLAGKFGPAIPLTRGSFVLDLGSLLILGSGVGNATGVANFLIPNVVLKAFAKAKISLFWQALIIDPKTFGLTATPAGRQRISL